MQVAASTGACRSLKQPRFQTLDEWLRWQESCHPSAIDLDLGRVRQVAAALNLLRPSAKVVTVAGTNGKGSCVAALNWLLRLKGARVGTYSSPHLRVYNERVQIDGKPVSDDALCSAFSVIDAARGAISLTYFEFGTLAALYLFSQQTLDYWVLEVGLGGRLDAVNIIDPDVAVITSIALDHTDWLGEDRESIGFEKAGICRAGVPLVCSDPEPPLSVLSYASKLFCPSYWIGQQFLLTAQPGGWQLQLGERLYSLPNLFLPPWSVAAALQVADLLGQLGAPDQVERDLAQLAQLKLPGRLQCHRVQGRTVVLDVAHNPAATAYLAGQLQQRWPQGDWQIVVAMMNDKNISDALRPLVPLAHTWHLAGVPNMARAAGVEHLEQVLRQIGSSVQAHSYGSAAAALAAALQTQGSGGILVTGSFYPVADALGYLETLETPNEIHG